MAKTAHIIKANDIKLTGSCKLTLPGSITNASAGQNKGPAQAKVISSNNSFAMIEVTCPCGEKLQLKCSYKETPQA